MSADSPAPETEQGANNEQAENKDDLTFKIQGVDVVGQQRYQEGHICSEAEAEYLCRAERNIVSAALNAEVKELVEDNDGVVTPEITQQVQEMVDKIWSEIKLGERRPGAGRTANPVRTRALQILRDRVREALDNSGHDVATIPAKQISAMAKQVLEKDPDTYMEQARQLLEIENQKFGKLELEID